MIEFKAECGHTVRARDEDSGSTVRCSYCGRTVPVPETKDDTLDFLFDELASRGGPQVTSGPRRKSRRGSFFKGASGAAGFNPFPIIVRLCYAALLLIIVVVVGRKFVIPLFDGSFRSPTAAQKKEESPVRRRRLDESEKDKSATVTEGLILRGNMDGLYVASTPPGASVYILAAGEAPKEGRISELKGCVCFKTPGVGKRIGGGEYVIEVVLPWNDPNLTRYDNYTEFRRRIERTSAKDQRLRVKEQQELVTNYFIPDEANEVFIDETLDQKYIVRQYRNVQVRDGQLDGIRALFLPRITKAGSTAFSIEQLVLQYIPEGKHYKFDEKHVRGELDFYGVPSDDHHWIIEALHRVGLVSYTIDERRSKVFKIGMVDGVLAVQDVRG